MGRTFGFPVTKWNPFDGYPKHLQRPFSTSKALPREHGEVRERESESKRLSVVSRLSIPFFDEGVRLFRKLQVKSSVEC